MSTLTFIDSTSEYWPTGLWLLIHAYESSRRMNCKHRISKSHLIKGSHKYALLNQFRTSHYLPHSSSAMYACTKITNIKRPQLQPGTLDDRKYSVAYSLI